MTDSNGNDDLQRKCLDKIEEELHNIQQIPHSIPIIKGILSGVVENWRRRLSSHNAGTQSDSSSSQTMATTSSSNDAPVEGNGNKDDLQRQGIQKIEEELYKIQQFPQSLPIINEILAGVVEDCRKELSSHNVGTQSEGISSQTTTLASSSNDAPVPIELPSHNVGTQSEGSSYQTTTMASSGNDPPVPIELPSHNVGTQSEGSSLQTTTRPSSSNDAPVLIEFLPMKPSSRRQETQDPSKTPVILDDWGNEVADWAVPFWRTLRHEFRLSKDGSGDTAPALEPEPEPVLELTLAPPQDNRKRKDRKNSMEDKQKMELRRTRLARKGKRNETSTNPVTSDWRRRLPPRPPHQPPQQNVTSDNVIDVPSSSSAPASSSTPSADQQNPNVHDEQGGDDPLQ